MSKKVWLINHYATNMYNDQGGRHYWFAEKLIEMGYDVTIFCANTYHNKNESIDTKNRKYTVKKTSGVPFVFVKTSPSTGNGFDRLKNMGLFYWNLFSVGKEYIKNNGKPDVIIASSVHPLTMVAGIQISKKYNIPCICEIRDLWPEAIFYFNKVKETSFIGRLLTQGERWIYENADTLIFTKEGDTDYIKEKGWDLEQGGKINLNRCFYINNGVDLENFDRLLVEETLDDKELISTQFNVVYVGAIRPVNDVNRILEAAKILEGHRDIQFLIYGDGNQREYLEQRIFDENINNVKMMGHVSKKYIPYILSKASLNILNYSPEQYNWSRGNSSNKLFEYMASGKPIISTVKMGYSIIDKYNCGLELKMGGPKELAEEVLQFKNMNDERYEKISQNSRNGSSDFDFNKLTDKLIHVIESTTKN